MKIVKINILGSSMWPSLLNGDELIVKMHNHTPYVLGDLVIFIDVKSKELTCHRVIDENGLTKGDRSYHNDLLSVNKMGIVLGVIRSNGQTFVWGKDGQPFKKTISFCSKKSLKESHLRYFFISLIYIVSKFSLLTSLLTTKSRKKMLQKDYPLINV